MRKKHSKKEVEEALRYAEENGWWKSCLGKDILST